MKENTEDRRIRRTKRLLKQGLAELLKVKEFKNISVRDITDHMDLNRGTFYLHYSDTYELLQKLETDALRDVQEMIDKYGEEDKTYTLQPIFEPILSYIVENRDICYSLFVNNASSNFIDEIQKLIYKNGSAMMHKRFSRVPEEKLPYLFSFITYGLIGLIKQWFDTDMSLVKRDIVVMADAMVSAAAESLIAAPAR
ncbi:MAG: TetR/AcrR family transcriptional regulator [Oscillospiraceae bacterium]